MINTLDYLYYKLYRATLKGSLNDIAEWAAAICFGGLIALNLFVIGAFLRKIDMLPGFFTSKAQVIVFMVLFFLLAFFLFLRNKRYKTIIEKFDQESDAERRKGNLFVWIYVILSFALVFAVAFYKPGKL